MMRAMTVEIHDVTPAHEAEVHAIHEALAAIGVHRPTLLVVPAFLDDDGKSWDLRDAPAFATWLRDRQAEGTELIQHGLTHRAPGPPPPGIRNAFMHYAFSRGCAEFAHLDYDQATQRLAFGRRILADCGLDSEGFVAPAWQQSPEAIEALTAAHFRYTAFLGHILALDRRGQTQADRELPAPALTFAAGQVVIDYGKRVAMRALEKLGRHRELLRIAVHPEDVHSPGLLTHILRRVVALRLKRRLITYHHWLNERGAS